MKTLRFRVALQLISGGTSCDPRQSHSRARVLHPGWAPGELDLNLGSATLEAVTLSKSLSN